VIRLRPFGGRLRRDVSPARGDFPTNTDRQIQQRGEGGFSLIEVAIAVAISAVVASALYTVINSAVSGDRALRVRVDLQLDAVRVLRNVTEVLKNTGPIDANSDGVFDPGDFPYIWTDGVSNAGPHGGFYLYLDSANAGIVQKATSAHEGLGAPQEIAFLLPRDVDGDTRPTRVSDGRIEWGTDSYAIVLVPAADGNELQLRRYNASWAVVSTRLLGRHVERITFETAATEPKPVVAPQQPLGANQFRVTAWFRRVVDKKVYTVRQTSTVNMRSLGD
jgi:prepilin-type N-terminal cleavage/methylation domain-containing protein